MTDDRYEEVKGFCKRWALPAGLGVPVYIDDEQAMGEPELLTDPPRIHLHTADYLDLADRVTAGPPSVTTYVTTGEGS